tara:strand:- start:284 stop:460 length:177 start_codon:yes stop_codon:yes gene_type:complete
VRQLQADLLEADAWKPELQAEQGARGRDGLFWLGVKKNLFQPKSSTATGFNTEADDLT